MALDRADAQNAALFTSIAVTLNATLEKLDGAVLRTTTIDPKTSFGGYVAFDLPKGATVADMVVVVTFAGDTHVIPLNNAAGKLQQATASDLSAGGADKPGPARLQPAAATLNMPTTRLSSARPELQGETNLSPEPARPTVPTPQMPASGALRMPTPEEFNYQQPQCGMTVTPNGVKLGKC
jgi:hypothetical protein